MLKKLPFLVSGVGVLILIVVPILAQGSATMSAAIVRAREGKVVISTRVSSFVQGHPYRIGIGCAGETAPEAEVTLTRGDTPLPKEPTTFRQGNIAHWWTVQEIACRGFLLSADELPGKDVSLGFKVSIPRETAQQCGKVYIFVSRDYGSGTWYLEDGSDLDETYW